MSCKNCFNGCAETVSDQCVKYTGIDIPALGIENGDTLISVENAITTFLSAAIIGTGIKPIIDDSDICVVVSKYLPACTVCTGFTLNELLTAIIKATCDIQTQVTTNTNAIATLNANYTIGCLTGVTESSDTHDIVQAVITKLCSLNSSFSALLLTLPITYVSINSSPGVPGINDYIQTYLDSQNFLQLAKDRMIPYSPIPYVGPLTNYPATGDSFGITGVGAGYWDKIYLCNGLNATPDLRGRTVVGVASSMGNSNYAGNPAVDPSNPENQNYIVDQRYGANTVTLTTGQIPNHNHPGSSVIINDPEHTHDIKVNTNAAGSGFPAFESATTEGTFESESASTGITATLTIAGDGGGGSHNNVQPVYATYYIIYIP